MNSSTLARVGISVDASSVGVDLFQLLPSGALRVRIVRREGKPADADFFAINLAFARVNPDLHPGLASEVNPAFLRSKVFAAMVRVADTGTSERFETLGAMLATRWFSMAVVRTGDDEVLALVEEITDRKQAELRLSTQYQVSRALADAEELANVAPKILQTVCLGEGYELAAMWIVEDGADRLRFVDEWHRAELDDPAFIAAIRSTAYKRGEGIPGRVWATGQIVRQDELASERAFPDRDGAARAGLRASKCFPILHHERVLGVIGALSSHPLPTDPQRRELSISIGRQIGQFLERTRAQGELRRLNSELELRVAARTAELASSNAELEAFSYSVSHDLRAPLRAINGYTSMLVEDHGDLPSDARRLVTTIRDRGARMGTLIDDLLAFSRLGRQEIRRHPVDMEALARTVVLELPPGPAQIEIGAIPRASGDVALLRQVWMNLIANAVKYSRGRETPRIEIGFADGSYFVKDNGVGFDMRYADKLFGVFQRLHREDEFEGTGVGLAIVRRIVERHGGEVWAEAKLDGGATFGFVLADGVD